MGMTVQEIRALLREADEQQLSVLERTLAADTRKGIRSALQVARRRVDAERAERERLDGLFTFERSLLGEGQGVIVGLDEVGRGAVAGPLAVGAVVLPPDVRIDNLNDSKQLTPEQREEVAGEIKRSAVAWTVAYVDPADIDRDGMSVSLHRAFKAALQGIEGLGVIPDLVLVDGNPLHIDPREVNVVKGDAKCASIAAASIVAKVTRDDFMTKLDASYPDYCFPLNKGYGSPQHIQAIKEHGLSDMHRVSFCRSFMQETLF